MLTIFASSPSQIFRTSRGTDDDKFFSLGRLSIFQQLSTGRQVFSSRRYVLQHFHFTRYATNYNLQLTNKNTWRPQHHHSRDILPHISNTASQHDIETLFNQWDGTRRHYQVKADRTLKPMSKTEKLAQQQTLKSLDVLAKISKRALWFDQALIRPPWNEAILRLDWRMGLARDPWR